MSLNLTQKERLLLEDQKKHEEICIQKYTSFANKAQDPRLKQMFNTHAQHEQQHLNTVNQILSGQTPNLQSQTQQQGMQQQGMQQQGAQQQSMLQNAFNQGLSGMGLTDSNDAALCNDLLMTEKYVSGAYDTAIFEMTDSNVRQTLNHIQKEEQQHGEDIFNYMKSMGMYNPQ
ncbi:spore coat protein [Phosphitispora fastidiosa]|uniref:spore coat protein n=1 Tax=Phosphitispora fastidiosa TaxID=2837202 RepID=UPI001E6159EC|nr:spore coat protein [Phosphitispora fastidiosa]MBU7005218.1 spore coat protein CotF [Phosphitispora fastidiosa]